MIHVAYQHVDREELHYLQLLPVTLEVSNNEVIDSGAREGSKIPVGAEEGMALRVPGKGYPPESADSAEGVTGDLLVVVRSALDPRFLRRGSALWRTESLDVADAVLGTEIRVPTLEDPVNDSRSMRESSTNCWASSLVPSLIRLKTGGRSRSASASLQIF